MVKEGEPYVVGSLVRARSFKTGLREMGVIVRVQKSALGGNTYLYVIKCITDGHTFGCYSSDIELPKETQANADQ